MGNGGDRHVAAGGAARDADSRRLRRAAGRHRDDRLRSGSWTLFDQVLIGTVGILVPLCRFMRGPLAPRAFLMLTTGFALTLYFLGRNGLAGGISVALITFTILASLSFSRSLGVAFITVALVAYVCVGAAGARHHLTINTAASDPLVLRNWIRIGGIDALLALLLIAWSNSWSGPWRRTRARPTRR